MTEHELAGATVLYSAASDRVASLNPTAAHIWSLCDGRKSLDELSAALSLHLSWPPSTAAGEVGRVTDRLLREGFLRHRAGSFERLRVSFAGRPIDLDVDCPRTASALASRFRHFLHRCPDGPPEDRFEIIGQDPSHYIACGSWSENHTGPFHERLRAIEMRIVDRIVQSHPALVWIHAGGAVRGEDGVLMAGSSGSGKSSITVALTDRGWQFAGDDLVALHPDGRMEPFPLTPVVRQPMEVQLPEERLHELVRSERHVAAQLLAATATVSLVVFPAYRFAAGETLEPLTPADALMLLVRQCTTFRRQRSSALAAMIALLGHARAFRLVYGSASRAAAAIAALSGGVHPQLSIAATGAPAP